MAKYEVLMSCGHYEIIQLFGPHKERDRKIEWFESSGLCTECWEAEKKRKYDEINQKAAEAAQEYGLPNLTGSEKQTAWANTLRQNWLSDAEKHIAGYAKNLEAVADTENYETAKAIFEGMKPAVEKRLLEETSARFWIDHRDDDARKFIDNAGRIAYKAFLMQKEAK